MAACTYVYKLRDKTTGHFSTGGWYFKWVPVGGKEWSSENGPVLHMKMLERGDKYHPKTAIPETWEIVKIEIRRREVDAFPARITL